LNGSRPRIRAVGTNAEVIGIDGPSRCGISETGHDRAEALGTSRI
jgi:hypothetical protein